MKKIIILSIISILIAMSLVSCGGGTAENLHDPKIKHGDAGGLKLPLTKNGEEITWFISSSKSDHNDSYMLEKMRGITGVNVQLIISPPSAVSEKAKVLIAAKQLPDIMGTGMTATEAEELSVQGAFAPVEDYINELPNFKSTFVDNKQNNWIFKSYQASDGKLYGFYGHDWNRDVNLGVTMYRKDIFDNNGIKMWNSTGEFYQAMKELKSVYPDSTPYAMKTKDNIFSLLSFSWGIRAHIPYYDEGEGVWKFGSTDPAYKDMLDFLKKLYNEKLIDPEFLTATEADWTSKMIHGEKAFVTTDWIGRMEQFVEQAKANTPEYDLRFANPIGPKQTMQTLSQLCWARYVANSDKSELAFRLLDFTLSPAGAELMTMGVEGETYEIDGAGMAKYLEFPNRIPLMNELTEKYGMFAEGMYLRFDRRSAYFNFTEREQEAQDFAKNPQNMDPEDPVLAFTAQEKGEQNKYMADLDKASREFSIQYVLSGSGGDSEWSKWVEKAESLGAGKLVDIYNEAQKRYNDL